MDPDQEVCVREATLLPLNGASVSKALPEATSLDLREEIEEIEAEDSRANVRAIIGSLTWKEIGGDLWQLRIACEGDKESGLPKAWVCSEPLHPGPEKEWRGG